MSSERTSDLSAHSDERALNEALAAHTLKRMFEKVEGRGEVKAPFAFNPYLSLAHSDLDSLLVALLPKLNLVRGRSYRSSDMPRLAPTLGAVVANALLAGDGAFIHYSRNKAKLQRNDAYAPDWLTIHNLGRQIADLATAGFLVEVRAPQGLNVARESVFAATGELISLCASLSITREALALSDDDPVIEMKGVEGNRIAQFDRFAEPYAKMASELRAYNSFLSRQNFGANPPLLRSDVNFSQTRLTRVFQGGSHLHGRFYGGFWQQLRRSERPQITINGRSTTERDYQGFVVGALYHLCGKEFEGDPYDIPLIRSAYEADGWGWPDIRPTIKAMVQVVINGSDLWRHWRRIVPPTGLTLKQAEDVITTFHSPIAARFSRTCGLELMNVDARIASRILNVGLAESHVVLPIHDGFIVAIEDSDWLEFQMKSSYFNEVGFDPVIH